MNTKQIKITDYNYPLPSDRIAKFPLQRRDSSKLLVYRHGNVSEDVFSNLPEYLPEGALMVFNNTKVIQARIHFRKSTGALIEVFLLEPLAPNDYELMFQSRRECSWLCLIGNQKKWKEGSLELEMTVGDEKVSLTATRTAIAQGQEVTFRWDNPKVSFAEIIDTVGELPIPPYLNRATQESDKTTYQTVYSKIKGSVAAPTAGLHFTPEVLSRIDGCGIHREEVTLHVGAGTFKPVKSSDIAGHDMHTEHFCVGLHTIEQLLSHHCKAIAVGTTSVRTLESLYYIGCRILQRPDIAADELHGTHGLAPGGSAGHSRLSEAQQPAVARGQHADNHCPGLRLQDCAYARHQFPSAPEHAAAACQCLRRRRLAHHLRLCSRPRLPLPELRRQLPADTVAMLQCCFLVTFAKKENTFLCHTVA